MKKIVLILLIACAVCTGVFAQQSIYVSAQGNDNNDGLSEGKPLKSIDKALTFAYEKNVYRVTVIGTLTKDNFSIFEDDDDFVFHFRNRASAELLITGKPNATGTVRAVLSAKGLNISAAVVFGTGTKIRFEHIEISGGEGEDGDGLVIYDDASVTLGPGTVIRGNKGTGVHVCEGNLLIDGGEVRDNQDSGIMICESSTGIMRSGTIRDNRSPDIAGGVYIDEDGVFTMSGGTITGNRAVKSGGGVYVCTDGRFDKTGGTITGNTAGQGSDHNVYRERGALGSN